MKIYVAIVVRPLTSLVIVTPTGEEFSPKTRPGVAGVLVAYTSLKQLRVECGSECEVLEFLVGGIPAVEAD